ncbi:MAG: ATP-binding protein [Eubacteriales bacterium]|nr:ATP-binding protein [Eubacteriales bacterium]
MRQLSVFIAIWEGFLRFLSFLLLLGALLLVFVIVYRLSSRFRRCVAAVLNRIESFQGLAHKSNEDVLTQPSSLAVDYKPPTRLLSDFEMIMDGLSMALLYFRKNGRLLYSNAAFETLFEQAPPADITELLLLFPDVALNAALLLQQGRRDLLIEHEKMKLHFEIRPISGGEETEKGILLLIQDVTERETLELQRKQFVANVSHELKTPLTTIKTYSETLLDWGLEEKQKDSIRKDIIRIYEDAQRMEQLVSDLLLLSSIDSRGRLYHMSEVDMLLLSRKLVERMQPEAAKKEIDLKVLALSHLPQVIGDYASLERIVLNLITNAIKYSDRGARVTVYLSSPLDDVHVNVSDSGYGIAPQHLKHIFERFYRVDVTGSRNYGGTGLGLSIAKELSDLHHARLLVRSSLGQGSSFHLLLPSAARIYKEALDLGRDGRTSEDPLIAYALKELLLLANDFGIEVESLTELSDEQAEDLLQQLRPEDVSSYRPESEELALLDEDGV